MNVVATEPDEAVNTDTTGADATGTDTTGTDAGVAGAEPESADARIRRRLGRFRWQALLSSILAVLLAMAEVVPTTDRVLWILLIATCVQFAFVVPASLVLAEPKRWARATLLVATPVSAAIFVVALTQTAWLLLPANVLLAAVFVPLREAEVREFVNRRDRSLADIRAGR